MSVDWTVAALYANLYNNAAYPYKNRPRDTASFGDDIADATDEISSTPLKALKKKVAKKNLKALIQLGLRYYVGATVPKDRERAKELWKEVYIICQDQNYQHIGSDPNPQAVSHALIASAYNDEFRELDEPPRKVVFLMAAHANQAVVLGLHSPITLLIARMLVSQGLDTHEWKENIGALLQLWEDREAEVAEERLQEERKKRKKPNAYVCAREGCGIRAPHKGALKRCGGRCAEEDKPSYCSKECQVKDWTSHKPLCRPGKTNLGPDSSQAGPSTGSRFHEDEQPDGSGSDGDLATCIRPPPADGAKPKQFSVIMPDGTEMVSSTLTPEFMREMRDKLAAEH